MGLRLYNTLTRTKEPFKSIEEGKVKMYVCGPTVYNFLHIGNFRGAIFFNLVRNWLEHLGYDVTYVYNYTDVDDKIIKKAMEEGVESSEISERYIAEFEKDFNNLKLVKHDHNPRVTEFMPQIIKFVEDLVAKGKAYVIDGEVFYEIDKFDTYGKLSGKKLEDLEAGQRVDVDERKKNPFDFVLWKPAKEGEPSWDSPWGKGRPGWHIECSAMIQSILGDTIDIHGGGIDLIFPHHENEIAQGEGRTEKCYCNNWMHNAFLNMNNEKMSKSLGNIISGRDFMDRYDPEVLKFLYLSGHYRSTLNFTDERIEQAISGLSRIYSALRDANKVVGEFERKEGGIVLKKFAQAMETAEARITKALNDDFNTAEVMAQIFEIVRMFNSYSMTKKEKDPNTVPTSEAFIAWLQKYGKMMSLFNDDPVDMLGRLDNILIKEKNIDVAKVEELVKQRLDARANKDYAESDRIRVELLAMGVQAVDGVDGVLWEVKK